MARIEGTRKLNIVDIYVVNKILTYHSYDDLDEGDKVIIQEGAFKGYECEVVFGEPTWEGYTYEVKKKPSITIQQQLETEYHPDAITITIPTLLNANNLLEYITTDYYYEPCNPDCVMGICGVIKNLKQQLAEKGVQV